MRISTLISYSELTGYRMLAIRVLPILPTALPAAKGRNSKEGGSGRNQREENKADRASILSHALLCFVEFTAMF